MFVFTGFIGTAINSDDEFDPQAEWTIVYDGRNRQSCSERALVLHSVGIPYQILAGDTTGFTLVAPASVAEKAKFEIWQYEQENRTEIPLSRAIAPDYEKAVFGVIAFVFIVVLVAWMSDVAAFGRDWVASGRIDGALIRDGEWWRAITALTLHGSIKHLLGNIVFGVFFGMLAGGLIGPGIAWLTILVSAAFANVLNVFLLDEGHRAIGASTAVFAALGLVAGFVWRAKLMAQEKWAWRLGPIIGGLALLAYTGTGGPNTDVGAHLAGFVSGFFSGTLITRLPKFSDNNHWQMISGLLAVGIICVAWIIALQT